LEPFLTDLERAFLVAARDPAVKQEEFYAWLAAHLGHDPYDFWITRRLSPVPMGWLQRQRLRWLVRRLGGGRFERWAWSFHGLECDVWNLDDGRFVRIDFGPSTRRLAITGWGVLQYVMTTRAPWRSFEQLRGFLAAKAPPYDELSGDHGKMSAICDRLEQLDLLVYADPELAALACDRSTNDAVTAHERDYPMDPYLAQRLVLSPRASALVEAAAS
jgi:hypothetical protein